MVEVFGASVVVVVVFALRVVDGFLVVDFLVVTGIGTGVVVIKADIILDSFP